MSAIAATNSIVLRGIEAAERQVAVQPASRPAAAPAASPAVVVSIASVPSRPGQGAAKPVATPASSGTQTGLIGTVLSSESVAPPAGIATVGSLSSNPAPIQHIAALGIITLSGFAALKQNSVASGSARAEGSSVGAQYDSKGRSAATASTASDRQQPVAGLDLSA